jgi:hypothetical protein
LKRPLRPMPPPPELFFWSAGAAAAAGNCAAWDRGEGRAALVALVAMVPVVRGLEEPEAERERACVGGEAVRDGWCCWYCCCWWWVVGDADPERALP